MKYEGDLQDLIQFGCEKIETLYVIKFQGMTISCSGKNTKQTVLFSSAGRARRNLEDHIYCNFCQGHYWHKGKNNTFAKEKGWERNSGKVSSSEKEFKVFAKQMTDQLLKDKIFTIEPVTL